jgi:putative endonuclease
MYIVYVLKSKHFSKSYVGITDNVERRLLQHNSSHNFYTKKFAPWILLHKEEYKNRIEARIREKYLKSATGRRYLSKTIFKN